MGLTLTPCMGRKCHHFINVGKYPRDCAHRPGMGTVKERQSPTFSSPNLSNQLALKRTLIRSRLVKPETAEKYKALG